MPRFPSGASSNHWNSRVWWLLDRPVKPGDDTQLKLLFVDASLTRAGALACILPFHSVKNILTRQEYSEPGNEPGVCCWDRPIDFDGVDDHGWGPAPGEPHNPTPHFDLLR